LNRGYIADKPQMDVNAMEKELWGRKFRIVDSGLDEAEVSAFVSSLAEQDNGLADKLKHIDSLVGNLGDQDNNLARKQEQLESLVASLTDQFNNFIQKLDQPQPVARHSDNSSAGIDNEKLEPLDSLLKFAEKTIVEAEKQAVIIKMEMVEKANSTATAIIADAREKAETEASKITAEAKRRAEEQAQNIVKEAEGRAREIQAPARQQADLILEEAK